MITKGLETRQAMDPDTWMVADLFCGAGGLTAGVMRAAKALGKKVNLVAVNHWEVAVATHAANFPACTHLCEAVEGVDPRKAVPGRFLHLLIAAPDCTDHSNAKGGQPRDEQRRASAWDILRWLQYIHVERVLIENVREFLEWGELDEAGKRIPERKGAIFRAFVASIRAMGYKVEWRLLCAADYGDATTRRRLFIQAVKGKTKKIHWPEPTHCKAPEAQLFPGMRRYKTAREIIDWSDPGTSIFNRETPLKPNTLRRIFAGLDKFGGLPFRFGVGGPSGQQSPHSVDDPFGTLLAENHQALLNPFLVILRNNCDARSVDDPCPTLCAGAQHIGLAQPFVTQLDHATEGDARRCRPVDAPIPTITGKCSFALVKPVLINLKGQSIGRDIDAPTPTITAGAPHLAFGQPVIVKYFQGSTARPIDEPCPTITANYEHLALANAVIIPFFSEREGQAPRCMTIDNPLVTITAQGRLGLARPVVLKYHGSHAGRQDGDGRAQSIEVPLGTIDTSNRYAIARPVIIQYNGTQECGHSVDAPINTLTGRDRFAIAEVVLQEGEELAYLDILFRMFKPKELAAATSFVTEYIFTGNREQVVAQIGNAVPVELSTALCTCALKHAHRGRCKSVEQTDPQEVAA